MRRILDKTIITARTDTMAHESFPLMVELLGPSDRAGDVVEYEVVMYAGDEHGDSIAVDLDQGIRFDMQGLLAFLAGNIAEQVKQHVKTALGRGEVAEIVISPIHPINVVAVPQ